MKTSRQARAFTRLAMSAWLLLVGCEGKNSYLSRSVPPADPQSYASEMESARAERDALFRRSPDSPVPADGRESWGGLEYYPVDPAMRFEGPLVLKMKPRPFTIISTSGEERPIQELGYFMLELEHGPEKLPVYQLLDLGENTPGSLFLPFMDATTEVETYPAGRYVEAVEIRRGMYEIDFNMAYNPSCAYGGDFSCPITPEANRLDTAIRAGERGYRYLHEDEPGS